MNYTGVDIITISHFNDPALKKHTFLNLRFTTAKQTYCLSKTDTASHFATRFPAKEAIIKALSGLDLYLNGKNNKIRL